MDDKKLEAISKVVHTPANLQNAVLATIALELRKIRQALYEEISQELRNIRREITSQK